MKVIERNSFEYDIVFVSVDVYSELMGVSKHILYHLIERGKINHLKLTRSVRIPISLVNSNKNPPDSVYKTRRELKKHFTNILNSYDSWLTIEEVCNILEISKSYVKRLLYGDELIYMVWHGTLLTLVDKKSLIDFIVNHCVVVKKTN